ncbi:hypothetical protein LIER_42823 [Lithospermum erythrorhizon]|uniref:Uncharacterized protein n=1 Tax=Lithospermum erythrorhizon TaxID=34254 RepID=A0AAV3NZ90_LITER
MIAKKNPKPKGLRGSDLGEEGAQHCPATLPCTANYTPPGVVLEICASKAFPLPAGGEGSLVDTISLCLGSPKLLVVGDLTPEVLQLLL